MADQVVRAIAVAVSDGAGALALRAEPLYGVSALTGFDPTIVRKAA